MSSYLSGLLTTTTSRYQSFRGLISTNENDGDTPDDTHLCRVMRSYYTEKGRGFPAWLPPDPKAPPPIQPVYAQPVSNVGAGYGGGNLNTNAGSKLGSLWDNQGAGSATASSQQASLRQGRATQQMGTGIPPNGRRGADPYTRSQTEAPTQARPLPSQRAGSYQTGSGLTPQNSTGGGGSAQERLKARLMGGTRAASPVSQSQIQPASQYDGGYEERFAAEASPAKVPARGLPTGGPRPGGGLPRGPRPLR